MADTLASLYAINIAMTIVLTIGSLKLIILFCIGINKHSNDVVEQPKNVIGPFDYHHTLYSLWASSAVSHYPSRVHVPSYSISTPSHRKRVTLKLGYEY